MDLHLEYAPALEPESRVVCFVPIDSVFPSPENDALYQPADPTDLNLCALAKSIRVHGIREPLVITRDRRILSGHRRHAAARLIGLKEVPCRTEDMWSDDPQFVPLLREYNRQREKTHIERLREEIISVNPEEAYQALLTHREQSATVDLAAIEIEGEKVRAVISPAKIPFLQAAIEVMNRLQAFWPVSVRTLHYQLLNTRPLRHARKSASVYENTRACYNDLSDLLTRARIAGQIPMHIIQDETRSSMTWSVHQTTTPFLRQELHNLLKGYRRNLQQSQPNHLEVCLEKNTIKGILEQVAGRYGIPVTTMRGYTSVPPRHAIAERFRQSGKETLILLVLSDFDPDGEEICHSLARSMRDDFAIDTIHPVKVGLTFEQVRQLNLPPSMDAKVSSSRCKKFVSKYGNSVYELEAVAPEQLQEWLRNAIDSVLDIEAFNGELIREKEDSTFLARLRAQVQQLLKETINENPD